MDGGGKLDLYIRQRKALIDHAAPILGSRDRAEDVVQDAWLRFAAAALPSLSHAASDERRALIAYLFRIVRNLALDGYRRLALERRLFAPEQDGIASPALAPSPEVELAARQEWKRVARALTKLPAPMRTAVLMHRLEGAKLREIAAHLNLSVTRAHELVAEGIERCEQVRAEAGPCCARAKSFRT
jgi:RNA polymerase sigma-70 factor (ECF subfamily)